MAIESEVEEEEEEEEDTPNVIYIASSSVYSGNNMTAESRSERERTRFRGSKNCCE